MTARLEDHEVRTLLAGLVEPDVIDAVLSDRSEYEHTPVVELGVDSLAVMELVSRVEVLGSEIDFDSFDLREVATLRAIAQLLVALRAAR